MFWDTDDCGMVRKYMPSTKIAVAEGKDRKKNYAEDMGE